MCHVSLLRRTDLSPVQECVLPCLCTLIFGKFLYWPAEQVSKFLVNHIPVGVQLAGQHMMGTGAIGFVTLFNVTRLKDQIPILNGSPDMFARIAITPFQNQSILIFVETSLSIEIVTIKHM